MEQIELDFKEEKFERNDERSESFSSAEKKRDDWRRIFFRGRLFFSLLPSLSLSVLVGKTEFQIDQIRFDEQTSPRDEEQSLGSMIESSRETFRTTKNQEKIKVRARFELATYCV